MSFKDCIIQDCKKVFLNKDEFSEIVSIKYDGDTYEGVPIILSEVRQSEFAVVNNLSDGIYSIHAIAYISAADIDIVPEQGTYISISDGVAENQVFYKKYKILSSSCDMGMIRLELEALDE